MKYVDYLDNYIHTPYSYILHSIYIYIYMVPPLYMPHIAIYNHHIFTIYTVFLSPSLTLPRL